MLGVGFGFTLTVSFIVRVVEHTGKVLEKLYSTPSSQVPPPFLEKTNVFVDWPVVNVICCEISSGPALKVWVFVPSVISTSPLLLFLQIDIVIAVPEGTVCSKFSVKVGLALLIWAEFVLFKVVPVVRIPPVELFGLAPPVALNPFPVIVLEAPP